MGSLFSHYPLLLLISHPTDHGRLTTDHGNNMRPQNIGFISTRFAGTDGVSLESSKWAEVLWHHKHVSYWFGGKLDRADDISMEVPEIKSVERVLKSGL